MKENNSELPGTEAVEEETIILTACSRMGGVLNEVWRDVGMYSPSATGDFSKPERHFWFRPRSKPITRIEVDAFNYSAHEPGAEETLRRSFWIRVIPPEATPHKYWILNEMAAKTESLTYRPYFLALTSNQPNVEGQPDHVPPIQNPSPKDMEETAQLMDECLQAVREGDREAIIALGEGW